MPRRTVADTNATAYRGRHECHGVPRPRRCCGSAHKSLYCAHDASRIASPWRKCMEQGKPVHRVDGCRPFRQGQDRGESRGTEAALRRVRLRPRLHLGAETRRPHSLDGPRRDGPHVDHGPQQLAAERAPLRRAAGSQQGGNSGEVRRGAGAHLAQKLRRSAATAGADRPAASLARPALSRPRGEGSPPHRVPEGHRGPRSPLLARVHCSRPARRERR